jgi:hypothetical protein
VSDPETSSEIASEQSVVGLRFPGFADVIYCWSGGVNCSIGDWVLVEQESYRRSARVIIEADRWNGWPAEPTWRVLRAFAAEEWVDLTTGGLNVAGAEISRCSVGSTGPMPSMMLSRAKVSKGALSIEDDLFRTAKRRLPNLGQAVNTRQGVGKVIAVDVVHRSITCVIDFDGSEIVEHADELGWVSNVTSE